MDRKPLSGGEQAEQRNPDNQMISIGAPVLSSTPFFATVTRPRTSSSLLRFTSSSSSQGVTLPYASSSPDSRALASSLQSLPGSSSTPLRRSRKLKIRSPNSQRRNQESAMSDPATPPAAPSSEHLKPLSGTPTQTHSVSAFTSIYSSNESFEQLSNTPDDKNGDFVINTDTPNFSFHGASPSTKLSFTLVNSIAGIRSLAPPITSNKDTENEFSGFRKLPTELRLKIWGYAIPATRILKVVKNENPSKIVISQNPDGTHSGRCSRSYLILAATPAVLHICRESRVLALQHYALAFHTTLDDRPIYFNFETDVFHFEDTDVLNKFSGNAFMLNRRTKKLHGDERMVQNMIVGKAITQKTLNLLALYTGLRKIVLQEQWILPMGRAKAIRSEVLESCAAAKLVTLKKDGGKGLSNARIVFMDELKMRTIAWNQVWREESFDN